MFSRRSSASRACGSVSPSSRWIALICSRRKYSRCDLSSSSCTRPWICVCSSSTSSSFARWMLSFSSRSCASTVLSRSSASLVVEVQARRDVVREPPGVLDVHRHHVRVVGDARRQPRHFLEQRQHGPAQRLRLHRRVGHVIDGLDPHDCNRGSPPKRCSSTRSRRSPCTHTCVVPSGSRSARCYVAFRRDGIDVVEGDLAQRGVALRDDGHHAVLCGRMGRRRAPSCAARSRIGASSIGEENAAPGRGRSGSLERGIRPPPLTRARSCTPPPGRLPAWRALRAVRRRPPQRRAPYPDAPRQGLDRANATHAKSGSLTLVSARTPVPAPASVSRSPTILASIMAIRSPDGSDYPHPPLLSDPVRRRTIASPFRTPGTTCMTPSRASGDSHGDVVAAGHVHSGPRLTARRHHYLRRRRHQWRSGHSGGARRPANITFDAAATLHRGVPDPLYGK